ncbi:MAG: family 1 encapsulin nanocompartment shell protein [Thermoprotei archaeon]
MLSKNPLELTPHDQKFTEGRVAEALRLSIIAELDAINLYLQLAEKIEDERFKKVFLDIAREEKTHVGEFLALLKQVDPEQVVELEKGAKEVEELTGIRTPRDPEPVKENTPIRGDQVEGVFTDAEWRSIMEMFNKRLNELRVLRRELPETNLGIGTDYALIYDPSTGETRYKKLCDIGLSFKIPQKLIDSARRMGELPALNIFLDKAVELSIIENKVLLEGCRGSEGIMNTSGVLKATMTTWEIPGSAVEDLGRALALYSEKNIAPPYKLFVNPRRYVKLLKVHEKTGIVELERIMRMVEKVVILPQLPDDTALLIAASPEYIDIVIGRDTTTRYIGPEDGNHIFYINENLTIRIKKPESVIILKEEKRGETQ